MTVKELWNKILIARDSLIEARNQYDEAVKEYLSFCIREAGFEDCTVKDTYLRQYGKLRVVYKSDDSRYHIVFFPYTKKGKLSARSNVFRVPLHSNMDIVSDLKDRFVLAEDYQCTHK